MTDLESPRDPRRGRGLTTQRDMAAPHDPKLDGEQLHPSDVTPPLDPMLDPSLTPQGNLTAQRDMTPPRDVTSVHEPMFNRDPARPGDAVSHQDPIRPARLRRTPAVRAMVAQTHWTPAQLMLPVFVADGISEPRPVDSMPGVMQHTCESAQRLAERAAKAGVGGVMLFGVPRAETKDAWATCGFGPDSITNRAIRAVREAIGDSLVVAADVCLDEFTDHGHCGLLDASGRIDMDATLPLYQQMAREQAAAGVDWVAPSGMMDQQVAAIRAALDEATPQVAILAYSAKYASAFYGPFRDAVGSSLTGDRRTYQLNPTNQAEGLREVELDVAEGADLIMVKPAGYYLDVIAEAARRVSVPIAAYQVSGEYAAIQAAAERGWLDGPAALYESTTAIFRAGAQVALTYAALQLAENHFD